MIKQTFYILITVVLTYVATIFSISWQDEALFFNITTPVKFGDTYYHNIKVHNKGWSPATNVFIELKGVELPDIVKVNAIPVFDSEKQNKGVGSYSRLRRNEIVNITVLAKKPVSLNQVVIKSDKSIASYSEEQEWFFDFYSFIIGVLVLIIIFGLGVIVSVRQFKEFRKKAYQAESDADAKNMLVETLEENMRLREEMETIKKQKYF